MRIQILTDNRTLHSELEHEHGLCIYLETDQHKLLLDCGASDIFIKNAEAMEIELKDVDYVFISHGHADHIGGLEAFLKVNEKAKILISDKALLQQYFSVRNSKRDISSKADLSRFYNRFIFIGNELHIGASIHVFKNTSTKFPSPKANSTLLKNMDDALQPDNFDHELIFAYGEKSLIAYSGCAHTGLLNILETIKGKSNLSVSILIGGFHLVDGNFESSEELQIIAKQLRKNYPDTKFMTGHCTGELAYSQLKSILADQLNYFYSGFTYIDKK